MGLRPRGDSLADESRAGGRMAPGGRRWSESPIPRPAVRRPRQVGVPVALDFEYLGAEPNGFAVGQADWTMWADDLLPDDIIVTWAWTETGTWSAPAGWTTVVSGSAGGLGYWLGWVRLTGSSDDLTLTRSDTTWEAYGVAGWWRGAPTSGLSMTATTPVTSSSTSSRTIPDPTASMYRPRQAVVFRAAGQTAKPYWAATVTGGTPDGLDWGSVTWSDSGTPGDVNYLVQWMAEDTATANSGTFTVYSDAYTTPLNVEMVSFAFGFTSP